MYDHEIKGKIWDMKAGEIVAIKIDDNVFSTQKIVEPQKPKEETLTGSTHKQCNKCKQILPITKFYKRKDSKDGYAHQCSKCVNDYLLQRRKKLSIPKPAGKLITRLNYFSEIHKNIVDELISLLSDGKKHRRTELNEIHMKYFPQFKLESTITNINRYLTYIGSIHNLKKERGSDSGLKKDYWIEPRKIIEETKQVEDIKISNGHIPLTPTGNKDKKSIGWSKFRIRG